MICKHGWPDDEGNYCGSNKPCELCSAFIADTPIEKALQELLREQDKRNYYASIERMCKKEG